MYQIICDGNVLYDPRSDEHILLNPKCKLEANTVCEASFTILPNHPHYSKFRDGTFKKKKSIFEMIRDGHTFFRGRMTDTGNDFYNKVEADLEGALAFANDTIVPPFVLENKTITWETKTKTCGNENIVGFFLAWILDRHNENVEEWQKLKLGFVDVEDANNNIARSSENYSKTWDILKSKLFDSSLGGYMYVRYENDGNYVDYVKAFTETNTQDITLDNLLDVNQTADANETYSAIMPLGADGLTIESRPNRNLSDDLIKHGKYIYSQSARAKYGWVCVPPDVATFDDITTATELETKAKNYMAQTAILELETVTVKAVDLSFTDDQINSFRAYRNTLVNSPTHGLTGVVLPMTKMELDILNPQNNVFSLGSTRRTMTERANDVSYKVNNAKNQYATIGQVGAVNSRVTEVSNEVGEKVSIVNLVEELNNADGIVKLLANRLAIESDKFTLSEAGSVVAKDITLKNETSDRSVDIADGIISVKSPVEIISEGEVQNILLMRFGNKGSDDTFALYCQMYYGDDLEWHFQSLFIRKVE